MREKKHMPVRVVEVVGAVKPDMSAEERYYARSRRIRKDIAAWMDEHAGEVWEDLEDMYADAANAAKCAQPTARRWLNQYCRPGQPWQLTELQRGFTLSARLRIREERL